MKLSHSAKHLFSVGKSCLIEGYSFVYKNNLGLQLTSLVSGPRQRTCRVSMKTLVESGTATNRAVEAVDII